MEESALAEARAVEGEHSEGDVRSPKAWQASRTEWIAQSSEGGRPAPQQEQEQPEHQPDNVVDDKVALPPLVVAGLCRPLHAERIFAH